MVRVVFGHAMIACTFAFLVHQFPSRHLLIPSHLLSPHIANPHVHQHIDFAFTSPYGGARAGRVKRKRAAAAAKKEEGGDEEDEE